MEKENSKLNLRIVKNKFYLTTYISVLALTFKVFFITRIHYKTKVILRNKYIVLIIAYPSVKEFSLLYKLSTIFSEYKEYLLIQKVGKENYLNMTKRQILNTKV